MSPPILCASAIVGMIAFTAYRIERAGKLLPSDDEAIVGDVIELPQGFGRYGFAARATQASPRARSGLGHSVGIAIARKAVAGAIRARGARLGFGTGHQTKSDIAHRKSVNSR